jgi:hypothetical protein
MEIWNMTIEESRRELVRAEQELETVTNRIRGIRGYHIVKSFLAWINPPNNFNDFS